MKVVAHPLVVAVALGLLGPDVLEVAESPAPTQAAPTSPDLPSSEDLAALEAAWAVHVAAEAERMNKES